MKNRYTGDICCHELSPHCKELGNGIHVKVNILTLNGISMDDLLFTLCFYSYGTRRTVRVRKDQMLVRNGAYYALLNEKHFSEGWLACDVEILEPCVGWPHNLRPVTVKCITPIPIGGCAESFSYPCDCEYHDGKEYTNGYNITFEKVDELPEEESGGSGSYDDTELKKQIKDVENNLETHIEDTQIHITDKERETWNKGIVTNEERQKWNQGVGGEVYAADEEDITLAQNADGTGKVYQFKDRDTSKGMGYIILRSNKTLAEQITEENTVYEIRYDFDLDGETLEIPADCVLDFKGGSFNNGNIQFNNTLLKGNINITSSFEGSLKNKIIDLEWFGNNFESSVQNAVNAAPNGAIIRFPYGETITISIKNNVLCTLKSHIIIEGNYCTIKIEDNTNTSSYIWSNIFFSDEGTTDIIIKNIILDCNGENNAWQYKPASLDFIRNGLYQGYWTNNIIIDNCTIKNNSGLNCIVLSRCDDVVISNCKFINCGVTNTDGAIADHSNIFGTGYRWEIVHNYSYNDVRVIGTGLDLNCSDSVIKNNYVENFKAGMNLSNNSSFKCQRNIVESNTFVNNERAINFWSYGGLGEVRNSDNVINNNIIRFKSEKYQYFGRGINLQRIVLSGIKNITITNNTIYSEIEESTDLSYPIEHAIEIGSPSYDILDGVDNQYGEIWNVKISGNTIYNITGSAIIVKDKCHNIDISNNLLYDCVVSTNPSANQAAIYIRPEWSSINTDYINIIRNTYFNDKYTALQFALIIAKNVKHMKIIDNDFRASTIHGMRLQYDIAEGNYGENRDEDCFVRGFLNGSNIGTHTQIPCVIGSQLFDTTKGIIYTQRTNYNNAYWKAETSYQGKQLPGLSIPRAASIVWSTNPSDTECMGYVVMDNADDGVPILHPFGRDCMCETMAGSIRPEKHAYGYPFFDTALGKPIWQKADGTWVDATGVSV